MMLRLNKAQVDLEQTQVFIVASLYGRTANGDLLVILSLPSSPAVVALLSRQLILQGLNLVHSKLTSRPITHGQNGS